MRWTIQSRLFALSALGIVGLLIMATIALVSGGNVSTSAGEVKLHAEQLETVNEARRETLRLMFVAMDALVDKDEGKVSAERLATIKRATTGLADARSKMPAMAETPDEAKLADEIGRQIVALSSGVTNDLPKLIEAGAPDAEAAKLDNLLDESGYALLENLLKLDKAIRGRSEEATTDLFSALSTSRTLAIVTLIVALLVVGSLTVVIGRSISGAIKSMAGAMRALANGDVSVSIPGRDREDEIGEMAGAVQVFKENKVRGDELAAVQEQERLAKEKRTEAVNQLLADFDREIKNVVQTVSSAATELEATAQTMTSTAEQTTVQASEVASASDLASTNVQTVASAAEELSSSIAEISRQVAQSASISGQAVHEAERTNTQVKSLADAAQKIGEVVNLINDIASQTNLLALNATIEAARAGEAGKGFAVVANEVKHLASQTAKATDEIGQQISAVQSATQESVDAIQGISSTITQVSEIASAIASAVEEQGAATQEIARNTQEAAHGTSQVSSTIGSVTQSAEATGDAARQLLDAAGGLSREADALRSRVERFLADIRAA